MLTALTDQEVSLHRLSMYREPTSKLLLSGVINLGSLEGLPPLFRFPLYNSLLYNSEDILPIGTQP